ncbi:uncharacterized protein LOC131958264 [Physella acuta]|uniref:uncharacterized protein LOC131958264 n=1 Tax=Physella acuta TaxID=109671 RepID=UPI0027DBD226|nr:uncharacterized protein LOC131958264 [Physella acuta]
MAEELNESSGQRKKNLIENVLVPALDNAIIKIAKVRKRQPHKCRNKAREISCNVIQYYSKVCVKSNSKLTSKLQSHVTPLEECLENLDATAKLVSSCQEEKKVLVEIYQKSKDNNKVNRENKLTFNLLSRLKLPHAFSCDVISE